MQTTTFLEFVQSPISLSSAPDQNKPLALFVDDDPELLACLRVALRKEMFEVLTAKSANEGLEILAQNRVDVVVSDQCMPGTKGVEFLGLVKELFPNTVRILMSGQAQLIDAARAVNEARISRFLVKPCMVGQLVGAIDQALFEEATKEAIEDEFSVVDRPWSAIEDLDLDYPGIARLEVESYERSVAETIELFPGSGQS